jgi:hypothetical protein
MNNRLLLLVLVSISFAGILVFVYQQQQILNNELKGIEPPAAKLAPVEVKKKVVPKGLRGTPPKIDPANDPLAPVALKPKKVEPPKTKEEPKKTYDFPESSPILAQ